MDFSFESEGINLQMELLEVDKNDSNSIRFGVSVMIGHSTGSFSYSADDIWLDTEMWEVFERQLAQECEEPAIFYDQSNYFELNLRKDNKHLELSLKIREPLASKGEIVLESSQRLDIDGPFIAKLRDSLSSFPKIW